MGMQVSYRICTKISASGNLQRYKGRCGPDIGNVVQKKRNRDHRSGMLPGPYPHASQNPAKIFRVGNSGVFEREEFPHDI